MLKRKPDADQEADQVGGEGEIAPSVNVERALLMLNRAVHRRKLRQLPLLKFRSKKPTEAELEKQRKKGRGASAQTAEQTKIQEQLAGEKAEREAIAIAEKKKREERDFIAARKEQEFRVQRLRASPIPKNRLRAEIEAKELEKNKSV